LLKAYVRPLTERPVLPLNVRYADKVVVWVAIHLRFFRTLDPRGSIAALFLDRRSLVCLDQLTVIAAAFQFFANSFAVRVQAVSRQLELPIRIGGAGELLCELQRIRCAPIRSQMKGEDKLRVTLDPDERPRVTDARFERLALTFLLAAELQISSA
jgi:hypothetical protein